MTFTLSGDLGIKGASWGCLEGRTVGHSCRKDPHRGRGATGPSSLAPVLECAFTTAHCPRLLSGCGAERSSGDVNAGAHTAWHPDRQTLDTERLLTDPDDSVNPSAWLNMTALEPAFEHVSAE